MSNHIKLLILLCAMALVSCEKQHYPLISAHRGGVALGMENSLSCIKAGIQSGADMIEIDVHLTKDKQVVVCHDYTLDRTTNMTGAIEDYTLDQLQSECRLMRKDSTVSDETIPTLEEVLCLCKDRCPILLEIKRRPGKNEGIEALCDSLVKLHDMDQQVVYQSFNPQSMEIIHKLDPRLRTEILLGEESESDTVFFQSDYLKSINVHYSMATPEYIQRVHNAGKEIKIWTLNEPDTALLAVDGIITNVPLKFVRQ